MGNNTPQHIAALVLMNARNKNSIIATQCEFRRQFPGKVLLYHQRFGNWWFDLKKQWQCPIIYEPEDHGDGVH